MLFGTRTGVSQTRVLEVLPDSHMHRCHFSTFVSSVGGSPGRQLYDYKPSGLQPQFLQFTYLSNRSVIFCYSYCACSYSQYIIQHMHCVIHHLWPITTPYREERKIYCYVDYIHLLWWVSEDGTSVSKHVAYIYVAIVYLGLNLLEDILTVL